MRAREMVRMAPTIWSREGGVGDVDGGAAGGDGDGDEAVGAVVAGGDEVLPLTSDVPGGVVAEVEDEESGGWGS